MIHQNIGILQCYWSRNYYNWLGLLNSKYSLTATKHDESPTCTTPVFPLQLFIADRSKLLHPVTDCESRRSSTPSTTLIKTQQAQLTPLRHIQSGSVWSKPAKSGLGHSKCSDLLSTVIIGFRYQQLDRLYFRVVSLWKFDILSSREKLAGS